jgi:hypothetical protein
MSDEPFDEWLTQDMLDEHHLGYGDFSAPDFVDLTAGFPRLPARMETTADFKQWNDAYDTGLSYADHPFADQCTCHVPLAINRPGHNGGTVDGLLYQLDLAPTVCELLGVEAPQRWDDTSFAGALSGDGWLGRSQLVLGQGARTCQRSVRVDRWMFVRRYHPGLGPHPKHMLFDLQTDRHETTNLFEVHQSQAEHCDHLLTEWWHQNLSRLDAGPDPMLTVTEKGGPWYSRPITSRFRSACGPRGRSWAANEIERRMHRRQPLHYMGELADPGIVRAVAKMLGAQEEGS